MTLIEEIRAGNVHAIKYGAGKAFVFFKAGRAPKSFDTDAAFADALDGGADKPAAKVEVEFNRRGKKGHNG